MPFMSMVIFCCFEFCSFWKLSSLVSKVKIASQLCFMLEESFFFFGSEMKQFLMVFFNKWDRLRQLQFESSTLWSVVWIILSCDANSVEEGSGPQYHVLSILLATMKHAGIREVRSETSGISFLISSRRNDLGRPFKETFSFWVVFAL